MGETGGFKEMICAAKEAEYFCREEWTGQITLELFGKLGSVRIEKSARKRPNRSFRNYTTGLGPEFHFASQAPFVGPAERLDHAAAVPHA